MRTEHRDVVRLHCGPAIEIKTIVGDKPRCTAAERKEAHEALVEKANAVAIRHAQSHLEHRTLGHSSVGGGGLAADPATCVHSWVRPNGRCYWCDTAAAL